MHYRFVLHGAAVGVACLLLLPTASARPASTAEQLIHEEQVREAVEDAFDLFAVPTTDGSVRNDNLVRAVDQLVAIGPEAIPYLVNELEQAQPATFFLSAYALGRIGTEPAEQALRAAVATADKQPGDWAGLRKAWSCWALGLMGLPDAIDLVLQGRHQTGHTPIHGNFTILESIALQTAPESLALLKANWSRFNSENDERYSERVTLIKAMGHITGPATRKMLVRVLREEHPLLARQAAYSLGEDDSTEAVRALLSALGAADVRVRRAAAIALYDALPVGALEVPTERLGTEENSIVRGALYKVIARAGGPPYTDVLIAQWGREDPLDRMQLVQVLPQLDREKVFPIVEQALKDPESQVMVAATNALAELGTPAATQALIDSVSSPFWTRASTGVQQLVRIHDTRATTPIASRLIDVELAGVVTDPRRRMRVEQLGDALVALGGTDRLDALREAASRQKDGHLLEYLEQLMKRLQTQRDNGKKSKRWLEALADPDPDVRLLAYDFLGRNGNARSARALVDMFGRVDPEEGRAILRALGNLDSEATRELIGRVLTAPEFDSFERASLRDMAAWSARQIGGQTMRDLLETAVQRRDGRDTRPLVYFAVVAGADAVPVLDRYRLVRMRYITWKRGDEMKKLDWIRRELVHGRSLDPVDLPPWDLFF